jgi:hypothetical protein
MGNLTPRQLANLFVCSNHFADNQYMCPDRSGRLLPNQFPSLNITVHNDVILLAATTQTSKNTDGHIPTVHPSSSVASGDVDENICYPTTTAKQGFSSSCTILRPTSNLVTTVAIVHRSSEESYEQTSAVTDVIENAQVQSAKIVRPQLLRSTKVKVSQSARYSNKRSAVRLATTRLKLKACQRELLKVRKELKQAISWKNKIPSNVAAFLEEQIAAASKKKRGHRWSQETKAYALGIYFKSPAALKVARNLLTLPSKSTLVKPLRNILEAVKIRHFYFTFSFKTVCIFYFQSGMCPVLFERLNEVLKNAGILER